MFIRHSHRTHRIRLRTLMLCCLLSVVVVAANVGYWYYETTQINATNQKTSDFVASSDKQIAAIKAENAAKEARRIQAARALAVESMTADSATAATFDSSVCNPAKTHNNPASIDVVVNKKHCMQPLTYEPNDLVTSNGATLSAKAITAFNQLFMAAAAAGEPFYVTSSYRSYTSQVQTYDYWVSTSGRSGADTYSARPGYSEHQTGLAFDVAAHGCVLNCFGTTSQYTWMQQHAADYGFIQRYYSGYEAVTGYEAEEWHYRYVGVTVAKDMQAKGIKTLEQYWGITGGDYE